MHQLKHRDCQSGLENRTQLYVVYKEPTLNIKIKSIKIERKQVEKDIPCYH